MIRSSINPTYLAAGYSAAKPFPHVVIDGFLDHAIAIATAESLERVDVSNWDHADHSEQVNKWWMPRLEELEEPVSRVLEFFNSQPALEFFERVTGIGPLIPDPSYLGGGVHISGRGGRLGVHADFNIHPKLGVHRRLNALLYLNRDWNLAWNGDLELYDENIASPVTACAPLFNRLAVFSVTDRAFHGVPKPILCPPNRRRISLALYYYTAERPEHEKSQFHWAAWQRIRGA